MKLFVVIYCLLSLLSCATVVDVEDAVQPAAGPGSTGGKAAGKHSDGGITVVAVPLDPGPPEIIIIEKPVYVPQGTPLKTQDSGGLNAVRQAAADGVKQPSEYAGAAMVYDYHPDFVYEVYTQPLRATDICLQPGERATEMPFISDSQRWMLGAGVSQENALEAQHIYIKPTSQGLEASLIINTDRRVYHVILKSYQSVHMPIVRWKYPVTGMPEHLIAAPSQAASPMGFASPSQAPSPGEASPAPLDSGIDPRYLSFNYRMTYGFAAKPRWLPTLVYDDGKKTYIAFPDTVLQTQMPAVYENRNNIVNYRVLDNVIIIDRLIEKITVKVEKKEIVIEKKRAP